jgi:hypothetical protein
MTVSASENATTRSKTNAQNVIRSLRDSAWGGEAPISPAQRRRKAKKAKKAVEDIGWLTKAVEQTLGSEEKISKDESQTKLGWKGENWGQDGAQECSIEYRVVVINIPVSPCTTTNF